MGVFIKLQNLEVSEETINSVALEYIEYFLANLHKSAFRYKNDVEAAGMTSYCLFDCSNLKLCSPTLINFDEIL